MNDYRSADRTERERILRKLIGGGVEGSKIDFKRQLNIETPRDKAELSKDLSSIANTDNERFWNDFGFIIFGAEPGRLVGDPTKHECDSDKLQSHLTNLAESFICPVPDFWIDLFRDPDVGVWGALVIPPSNQQPHVFIRDAEGVAKHEWWVRVNDTKRHGSVHDYARFLAKAVQREVRPLERQVQRLAMIVENQRSSFRLDDLLEVLRGSSPERARLESDGASGDVVNSVRNLLITGANAVEDALIAEALRVAEVMNEDSERNPLLLAGKSPEDTRNVLAYLEEQTLPLAEALATIARYDRDNKLTESICRAIRVIAKEPEPTGRHYANIAQLRLYPLALCLYSTLSVAANEDRGNLVISIFQLSLQHRDGSAPIVTTLRRMRAAIEVFNESAEHRSHEAIGTHIHNAIFPKLANLLAGTTSKEAFYITEFISAIVFLNISKNFYQFSYPLPGCYSYEWEARRTITDFLSRRRPWLLGLLNRDPAVVLQEFDQTAIKTVKPGWGDGFITGALEAYERGTK